MKRVSTFAARLLQVRQERQLTLEEFSQVAGFPPQTLNRWERNLRSPKVDMATQVAESLGVSPLWLFGYDVPQYTGQPVFQPTQAEVTMLKKYRALSPPLQDVIAEMIDREYEKISPRLIPFPAPDR